MIEVQKLFVGLYKGPGGKVKKHKDAASMLGACVSLITKARSEMRFKSSRGANES